tara:strand:+ start:1939 stop:2106 length:168 start_codon:yes stop_codon:yes gene_type:complete
MIKTTISLIFLTVVAIGQYDYSLEDINPSSENYGLNVGTSFFEGSVTVHFFGHFY